MFLKSAQNRLESPFEIIVGINNTESKFYLFPSFSNSVFIKHFRIIMLINIKINIKKYILSITDVKKKCWEPLIQKIQLHTFFPVPCCNQFIHLWLIKNYFYNILNFYSCIKLPQGACAPKVSILILLQSLKSTTPGAEPPRSREFNNLV